MHAEFDGRPFALLVLTMASMALGCGGTTAPEGGATTAPDGGASDPELACPANPPANGSSCRVAGTVCEFGDDLRPGCRMQASCEAAAWQLSFARCPPLPGSGEQGCPTQISSATGECSQEGLLCDMGGGAVCACGTCLGSCTPFARWVCRAPPATPECPPVAPRTGAACSSPDQLCAYGVCATPTHAWRTCRNGAWLGEPGICAS